PVRAPPGSTLFPYTTLFRSCAIVTRAASEARRGRPLLERPPTESRSAPWPAGSPKPRGTRAQRNSFGVEKLLSNVVPVAQELFEDRKSTRLNSSHVKISYAV